MLTGLNHITIAVSDISKSLNFYVEILGFTLKAKWDWDNGAYLIPGELWLCLSVDTLSISNDYTHYAFSIPTEKFDVHMKEWNFSKESALALITS